MTSPVGQRISVVMPVRDGAGHIEQSLRSVLAQDWPDLEILVVDDGSTDGTAGVVTGLGDARIRLVRQGPRGIVTALNRGLGEASGAMIARMDADDVMLPGRLAAQAAHLRSDPGVVACGTDYELFGAMSGRVRTPRRPGECRARLLFGSPIAHPTAMIRATGLRGLRYREEYAGAEDFKLFSELAGVGELANLPVVGLRYRRHAGQLSSAGRVRQRDMHLRICRENLAAAGAAVAANTLAGWLWPAETPGDPPGIGGYLRDAVGLVPVATRAAGWHGFRTATWLLRENLATLRAARRPPDAVAAG